MSNRLFRVHSTKSLSRTKIPLVIFGLFWITLLLNCTNPGLPDGGIRLCRTNEDCAEGTCILNTCQFARPCPAPETLGKSCEVPDAKGPCLQGLTTCRAGLIFCSPLIAPKAEECDGIDNDCNGKVDEHKTCLCTKNQKRSCYTAGAGCTKSGESYECIRPCKPGVETCVDGAWSGICENEHVPEKIELCDNIDNDCNGKIDDDPKCACKAGDKRVCGTNVGECREGSQICGNDNQWGPCTGGVKSKAELCNDKDDDCDGIVDNNPPCECKIGSKRACYPEATKGCIKGPGGYNCQLPCKSGLETCVAGKWDGKCEGVVTPTVEICNGVDDDCNGQTDDKQTPPKCECKPGETKECGTNTGECKAGKQTCGNDRLWGPCQGEVKAIPETCNGKDDNCDGIIDNNPPCVCKIGEKRPCYSAAKGCTKTGSGYNCTGECKAGEETCTDGLAWSKCEKEVLPKTEVCGDGFDNDCDGSTDPVPPCSCVNGQKRDCYPPNTTGCKQNGATYTCTSPCKTGIETCSNSKWGTCVGYTGPSTEKCGNGADDNCDGQIDENCCPTPTRPCYTGTTGCTKGSNGQYTCVGACKAGIETCTNGTWSACTGSIKPQAAETCGNGTDDNCNGQIDEGCCPTPNTRPCYAGTTGCTKGSNGQYTCVGTCKAGTQTCTNGTWSACAGESGPGIETCNRIDDDCDGIVDEVTAGYCTSLEVKLPNTTFSMGGSAAEVIKFGQTNEGPQRSVTLTNPFVITRYQITQREFEALMGYNPSTFSAPNSPVEMVSWHTAALFANELSRSKGLTPCFTCSAFTKAVPFTGTCSVAAAYTGNSGKDYYTCPGYRLPTEAEWEYAARAGTSTHTYGGDLISATVVACIKEISLDTIAWYCNNASSTTHAVGLKTASSTKLNDMIGNVFEWTLDTLSTYAGAITDPITPGTTNSIVRGCSYASKAYQCRASYRIEFPRTGAYSSVGFRLVRTCTNKTDANKCD